MPTNRRRDSNEEDLVRLYLAEIGQHPLLTKADEIRLAKVIEEGRNAAAELASQPPHKNSNRYRELQRLVRRGERAERTFINANLRLVVSIAKKYTNRGLELMDLIQEGNLGMMHAVEKFDWRKGFKFSTYATWWIRQAVQRAIANKARLIRLPIHVVNDIKTMQTVSHELMMKLGREPTPDEIANRLDWSVDEVAELQQVMRSTTSLNEELGEDSSTELGDMLGLEPDMTSSVHLSSILDSVWLSPDQRAVLDLHYFEGKQFASIERELGWGRNMARRRHHEAIAIIQDMLACRRGE